MNKGKECATEMSLDSSLTNMVLSTSSEKIRRPPNSFMLFAREHRQSIAKENPSVSNKIVSTILGKIWKETDQCVKQKYFKKAEMLDKLHKARYPGYFYSPKVARMKKEMKKTKWKKELKGNDPKNGRTAEVQGQEEKNNANDDWTSPTSRKEKSSFPEYVPNNPEYFSAHGEEKIVESINQLPTVEVHYSSSESSLNSKEEVPPELHHRWNMRQENYDYGFPYRMEARSRHVTSLENYDEKEIFSHYYRPHPSSAYYNPTGVSTGPASAFCCRPPYTNSVPNHYEPRFHPYWYPPSKNSLYHQYRDPIYDEYIDPFRFPIPYHAHDYYPPPFRFLEKPTIRLKRNSSSCCNHLDKGLNCSRKCDNENVKNKMADFENVQNQPFDDRSSRGGGIVADSYTSTMRNEDDMFLKSRKMTLDAENAEQSLCYIKPNSKRQEVQGLGDSSCSHTYPINAFENQFTSSHSSLVHAQNKIPNRDKYDFDQQNVDFGGNVSYSSAIDATKCHGSGVDAKKSCRSEMQPVAQPRSNCVTTSACVNTPNTDRCLEDDDYIDVCDLKFHAEPSSQPIQSENSAFRYGEKTSNYTDYITGKEFYSRPSTQQCSRPPLDSVGNNDSTTTCINAFSTTQNASPNEIELNNGKMYVRDVRNNQHDPSVNYAGETSESFTDDQRIAETEIIHPKMAKDEPQFIQPESIARVGFHRSSPLTTMALYGNKINYARNRDIRNYIKKPVARFGNNPYVTKRDEKP